MTDVQYPHRIENGHGEILTFVRRVGDRLEVENETAPSSGPPMHVHHRQREVLTVRQGRIGFQRPGGPEQFAGPGETVAFEAGDPHRFWNAGDTPLRCDGFIEPIDNIEYFLGEVFASQRRLPQPRVGIFDAAFLLTRYRTEFTMLAIPAPVQRFVFPLVLALGHLLGRYARFADAPAPIPAGGAEHSRGSTHVAEEYTESRVRAQ